MSLYSGINIVGRPDLANVRKLDLLPVPMIRQMHQYGIAIDRDWFKELSLKMDRQLHDLRGEICTYIPEEKLASFVEGSNLPDSNYLPMNVNSRDQLSKLLFDTLGIGAGRQLKTTKSGDRISTSKKQLEAIKKEHPILPRVLLYAEVHKLKSTYADSLPEIAREHPRGTCWCGLKHVASTWRVHTEFLDTRTDTGRLASKDPNLQNIPARSALGRELRKGFIASPGCVLVSVDYSQEEMRLGAHYSEDKNLIRIFELNIDPHHETAKLAFNTDTPDYLTQRTPAKNVNFGVFYGLAGPGLYDLMAITYATAGLDMPDWLTVQWCEEFIATWFRDVYPGVLGYLEQQYYRARRYQMVWTLFGRIRRVPEVRSTHRHVQNAGLRQAGNLPIQGCLPADARVLTKDGWLQIREWKGQQLWTGECWADADLVDKGEAPRVRLHLSDGRTFDCDNRHKLLGYGLVWQEWVDVLQSTGRQLVRDVSPMDWGQPDNHTVEDWYWAGRMIGDGALNMKTNVWSIAFSSFETDDVERCEEWLKTKDIRGGTSSKTGWKTDSAINGNFKVRGNTKAGIQMWLSMFPSGKSRIHSNVFKLDRSRRQSFFDGYYDADGYHDPQVLRRGGHIGTKHYHKITSCSHELLEDTLRLAQTLGITGNIGKPNFYRGKVEHVWWDIHFHAYPLPLTVRKIDVFKAEQMFTFTVHDNRHSFSTEGLISKNTGADIMRLAMGEVNESLEQSRRESIWAWPLLTVHDDLIVEFEEDYAEFGRDLISSLMSNVLRDKQTDKWCCRVPLVADGKIMTRWQK